MASRPTGAGPAADSDSGAGAAPGELSTVDGMAQLGFVIQGTLERRAAEQDLSLVQMRLLGVLRDRTPTMNQLATLLGLDKSSVTGLVDRAERRGLVARTPSATDRRAVLVGLTTEGRMLASRVGGRFESDVVAMLECLSGQERDALAALVSRILVAHAAARGVDLFANITVTESATAERAKS
jgi:DNA-binding MarR family transcriptional regulator